jgi:hypothetical protein
VAADRAAGLDAMMLAPTRDLVAAVLDCRLPEPAHTDPGPLPWLSRIPQALHDHSVCGEYLAKRSQLVINLADHVRNQAGKDGIQPIWAPPGSQPSVGIIGEVAVWWAANGVDPWGPTTSRSRTAAAALTVVQVSSCFMKP